VWKTKELKKRYGATRECLISFGSIPCARLSFQCVVEASDLQLTLRASTPLAHAAGELEPGALGRGAGFHSCSSSGVRVSQHRACHHVVTGRRFAPRAHGARDGHLASKCASRSPARLCTPAWDFPGSNKSHGLQYCALCCCGPCRHSLCFLSSLGRSLCWLDARDRPKL
jgi:hypothetical protein